MKAGKKPSQLSHHAVRALGSLALPGARAKRFCIVSYHRILETADPILPSEPDVDTFRWQAELLGQCFNVMPLHEAVRALHEQRLPARVVCITFDDGYRSTYDLAFPILRQLGLPATVFTTTGYCGGKSMWNDQIVDAVRSMPGRNLDLRDVGLGLHALETVADKRQTINKLTAASKYLAHGTRHQITQKLVDLVGAPVGEDLMLTREMILNLSRNDIEIGGHTVSHPILSSLPPEQAREEIIQNKAQLEEITGIPARLFAYPNGKPGLDFDRSHVQMVREAGYVAAFTTSIGAVDATHDLYQLPRGRPWDASPFMFGARLLYWLSVRES